MTRTVTSLLAFAEEKLSSLDARHQRRSLILSTRDDKGGVHRRGHTLRDFSSNDYCGLAHDARVKDAAMRAVRDFGASASASRLVTGSHPLFAALESRLAEVQQKERALVVGSGYLANLGAIPALVGGADVVFIDAFAHACLFTGARLSNARVHIFPHQDLNALSTLLHAHRHEGERALVVTESVFSMDGDVAPLDSLSALSAAHDAWLFVDDAHGPGTQQNAAHPTEAPLVTGTLSKAYGSYGGYVAAPAVVVELLTSRLRPLVYSTGLPPAAVGAALGALDVLDDEPWRHGRALLHAQRFCAALGRNAPSSAIVPIVVGDERDAMDQMRALETQGFLVVAIRPPTVPAGTARLRVSFSAAHSDDDVDALADAFRSLGHADDERLTTSDDVGGVSNTPSVAVTPTSRSLL